MTLGHPNKAFGSARTARGPRARELVAQRGGLSAAGRATRGQRAILADPNALLGWPKVTEAARLPGRGVEPQATNLRAQNHGSVQAVMMPDVMYRSLVCLLRAALVVMSG